jgi:hypothetical protein
MLTDFTFKDTGITVKIKKISPMVVDDVRSSIPEPLPPEQEVDYGEPRGKVMERNYSDPNYTLELREHERKASALVQKVIINRAVVLEGDEWKAEVQDYRNFILENTGQPLAEKDDLLVYILRICVGSNDDMNDLVDAIIKRSQPTQEAVEQAKRSFRG